MSFSKRMNQTVNNLKDIPLIQKTLKESGYYDIERISKEIAEHCDKKNIPLEEVLREIEKGKPWEYIKGETEFFGNRFFLNSSTLIPRIETEQIIEIATDFLNTPPSYKYVIDVGTGSGCTIISLIKNLCAKNTLKFFATDINSEALEVARKNSVLHKVNEKVSLIRDNLIEDINVNDDVFIIANLPYVPTSMYEKLDKSVKDYEPKNAIDGGKDGLKYYKELLEQIKEKKLLEYKCTLLIEIEPSTIEDVRKLFSKSESFEVYKDFRDKERFCLIHLS